MIDFLSVRKVQKINGFLGRKRTNNSHLWPSPCYLGVLDGSQFHETDQEQSRRSANERGGGNPLALGLDREFCRFLVRPRDRHIDPTNCQSSESMDFKSSAEIFNRRSSVRRSVYGFGPATSFRARPYPGPELQQLGQNDCWNSRSRMSPPPTRGQGRLEVAAPPSPGRGTWIFKRQRRPAPDARSER